MKINLLTPTFALLAIVFIALCLYQCESAKNSKLSYEARIHEVEQRENITKATIRIQEAGIKQLQEERIQVGLKFESIVRAQESKIKALQGSITKIRPEVVKQTDSLPLVRRLITLQDSVILSQGQIISSQHDEIVAQSQSYLQEIALMGAKNVSQVDLTEIWKTHAVETEKKLKKEQRRKRFWRGVGVVGVSCAVVLGLAVQ